MVNVGIIGRSWYTQKQLQDGSRVILDEPDPGYNPYSFNSKNWNNTALCALFAINSVGI